MHDCGKWRYALVCCQYKQLQCRISMHMTATGCEYQLNIMVTAMAGCCWNLIRVASYI